MAARGAGPRTTQGGPRRALVLATVGAPLTRAQAIDAYLARGLG